MGGGHVELVDHVCSFLPCMHILKVFSNVPGLKKRKTIVTPKVIKNGQSDIAKMKAARRRRNLNCPIDPQLEGSSSAQSSATVTTCGLDIMHSGHVRLPGTISFYLSSFHSTLTPVSCTILICSPSVHNPLPNPFTQLLYMRYP